MPELPEAELARRQLERWLSDRPIVEVILKDPAAVRGRLSTRPSDALPDPAGATAGWVGRVAGRPRRHGKRIGLPLGPSGVLVHLGMTGKLLRAQDPPPYARVGLRGPGGTAWLVDRRRFACLVPVAADALDAGLRAGHGPDALDAPLSTAELAQALRGRVAIKTALLDQARLAGLGNIHAAEALFHAGIDPRARADALPPAAVQRLGTAILAQLQRAIAQVDGEQLAYLHEGGDNPFAVYAREGQPCPRCAGPVARILQSGRSTFFCPACQVG